MTRTAIPQSRPLAAQATRWRATDSARFNTNNTMESSGVPHDLVQRALPILGRVIAQSSNPLALHLTIHVLEGRPLLDGLGTGVAEAAADSLARVAAGVGHLVHMPSHIYARVGRFAESVAANEAALNADMLYTARGETPYLTAHNAEMLVFSAALGGLREPALRWSRCACAGAASPAHASICLRHRWTRAPPHTRTTAPSHAADH